MERDWNYRKHKKDVKTKKKRNVLKHVFFYEDEEFTPKLLGRLNKGKIHCSCPLCSTKTAAHGLKDKQKGKWSEMKKQIDEEL